MHQDNYLRYAVAQQIYYKNISGGLDLVNLKYQLKKTCAECPYTAKTKGWIGPHNSAKEFHDIAVVDQPHPCHIHKRQSCVGNAIYMNKLCKMSIDTDKVAMQRRLREENKEEVLFSWDGQALVNFHGK